MRSLERKSPLLLPRLNVVLPSNFSDRRLGNAQQASPVSVGLDLAKHAGPPGTASSSSDAHWPAVPLGVRPSLAMDLDPSSFTCG